MISPTPNVKNFDLNDDIFLDELENSLSVDRSGLSHAIT